MLRAAGNTRRYKMKQNRTGPNRTESDRTRPSGSQRKRPTATEQGTKLALDPFIAWLRHFNSPCTFLVALTILIYLESTNEKHSLNLVSQLCCVCSILDFFPVFFFSSDCFCYVSICFCYVSILGGNYLMTAAGSLLWIMTSRCATIDQSKSTDQTGFE